jgi:hypothetical protein
MLTWQYFGEKIKTYNGSCLILFIDLYWFFSKIRFMYFSCLHLPVYLLLSDKPYIVMFCDMPFIFAEMLKFNTNNCCVNKLCIVPYHMFWLKTLQWKKRLFTIDINSSTRKTHGLVCTGLDLSDYILSDPFKCLYGFICYRLLMQYNEIYDSQCKVTFTIVNKHIPFLYAWKNFGHMLYPLASVRPLAIWFLENNLSSIWPTIFKLHRMIVHIV